MFRNIFSYHQGKPPFWEGRQTQVSHASCPLLVAWFAVWSSFCLFGAIDVCNSLSGHEKVRFDWNCRISATKSDFLHIIVWNICSVNEYMISAETAHRSLFNCCQWSCSSQLTKDMKCHHRNQYFHFEIIHRMLMQVVALELEIKDLIRRNKLNTEKYSDYSCIKVVVQWMLIRLICPILVVKNVPLTRVRIHHNS